MFENVVWTAPDGKKLAEVPEMNVSANLFDILKGSFGINSINSISIEKPQFAVNYTDKDGLDIINYINFPIKMMKRRQNSAAWWKLPTALWRLT